MLLFVSFLNDVLGFGSTYDTQLGFGFKRKFSAQTFYRN